MLRRAAVWTATVFCIVFSGLTGAWAVVVTTEVVTEGEPVPNAEITFETPAGEPVDLFVTETEEPPQEEASSQVPEPQTPTETTSPPSPPEPAASATPAETREPDDGQEVAVPADGELVSEPREDQPSGVPTPKREVVTSVTTNAEGEAQFEIDDRYRGQSLIMVVKKDGRVIERRRVIVGQGRLDLSLDVPASALSSVPESPSTATSTSATDYGTDGQLTDSAETVSTPSYEPTVTPSSAYAATDAEAPSEVEWANAYLGFAVSVGAGGSESDFHHAGRKGSTSADWKAGAVEDIYAGVNVQVAPRVFAGAQVEGALSQMQFNSSTDEVDGVRVNPQTNEMSRLDLEWMISVIGRLGWLATPETLIYGLAGWTYGHFEVNELVWQAGFKELNDFGSNGFTVGAGGETKIAPMWTLRAEYRYTNFSDGSFSLRPVSAQGGTTQPLRGSFENEMHVGRIGITRYFNLGLE